MPVYVGNKKIAKIMLGDKEVQGVNLGIAPTHEKGGVDIPNPPYAAPAGWQWAFVIENGSRIVENGSRAIELQRAA